MRERPRCGAKTRAGTESMARAVTDKARCRMHGAAKESGAPVAQNALKHGMYAKDNFDFDACPWQAYRRGKEGLDFDFFCRVNGQP